MIISVLKKEVPLHVGGYFLNLDLGFDSLDVFPPVNLPLQRNRTGMPLGIYDIRSKLLLKPLHKCDNHDHHIYA